MEKDTSLPNGERYTLLSIVVYWLFVRTIGFKILLFPIIDSLGNPLKKILHVVSEPGYEIYDSPRMI